MPRPTGAFGLPEPYLAATESVFHGPVSPSRHNTTDPGHHLSPTPTDT
jgi:hypothetical protein